MKKKTITLAQRNGLLLPEFGPGDLQIVLQSPRFVFRNGQKGRKAAKFAGHSRERGLPRDRSDLAGRTLEFERSSNGKGSRTTLFLVTEPGTSTDDEFNASGLNADEAADGPRKGG